MSNARNTIRHTITMLPILAIFGHGKLTYVWTPMEDSGGVSSAMMKGKILERTAGCSGPQKGGYKNGTSSS